jgi:uncharacterized membrane protein
MYFKHYFRLTLLFTFLLLLIRIIISNKLSYIFLPWNVLLAYIPWAISNKYLTPKAKPQHKFVQLFIFMLWLLFLPNAPYIITDLMHLRERLPIPFYYDIVLVFMSALSGLVFFYLSVAQVELWWCHSLPKYHINWFYSLAFGLCSFGIYLGRYGRFNSWNILTRPQLLFNEIADRFLFPFHHPRTWAVTILYSVMLFLFYQMAKNYKSPAELYTRVKQE